MANGFVNFIKRATAWVLNDTVMPADMNRYENGIEDTATAIDGMLKQSVISAPGGGAVYFSSTNKVVTLRANSVFSSADGFDTNGKIKTQVITNTTEKTVTISDTIINDTLVFIFNPVEGFSYVSQDSIIYKDGVPDLSHEYIFSISQQTWFKYSTSLQKVNIAIVAIARIVNGQIVDYEVPTISSLEDKLDKSLVNISEMGKARLANLLPVPPIPPVVDAVATYVVDSNQKLADWLNNVAGNDYTHVLIKKGTWTFDTTDAAKIYLLTSATKVVVGEGGSKIVCNKTVSSSGNTYFYFGYAIPDSGSEVYCMYGVSIEITCQNTGTMNGYAYGFYNCTKLTNCICRISYIAFDNCSKLVNCYGTGTARGFSSCDKLTNCTGEGSIGTGLDTVYGFYQCEYLTNCEGNGRAAGGSSSFFQCDYLVNCVGNGTPLGNGIVRGFNNCAKLTNCISKITANTFAQAFFECTWLVNCEGSGISVGGGYGFYRCRILMSCRVYSQSSSTYFECFMHSSGTTDSVADTAAGGYNS